MDVLDSMIRYEAGELIDEEIVELFQELIDTGLVWSLQGCYGRAAERLIRAKFCTAGVCERG